MGSDDAEPDPKDAVRVRGGLWVEAHNRKQRKAARRKGRALMKRPSSLHQRLKPSLDEEARPAPEG